MSSVRLNHQNSSLLKKKASCSGVMSACTMARKKPKRCHHTCTGLLGWYVMFMSRLEAMMETRLICVNGSV